MLGNDIYAVLVHGQLYNNSMDTCTKMFSLPLHSKNKIRSACAWERLIHQRVPLRKKLCLIFKNPFCDFSKTFPWFLQSVGPSFLWVCPSNIVGFITFFRRFGKYFFRCLHSLLLASKLIVFLTLLKWCKFYPIKCWKSSIFVKLYECGCKNIKY